MRHACVRKFSTPASKQPADRSRVRVGGAVRDVQSTNQRRTARQHPPRSGVCLAAWQFGRHAGPASRSASAPSARMDCDACIGRRSTQPVFLNARGIGSGAVACSSLRQLLRPSFPQHCAAWTQRAPGRHAGAATSPNTSVFRDGQLETMRDCKTVGAVDVGRRLTTAAESAAA